MISTHDRRGTGAGATFPSRPADPGQLQSWAQIAYRQWIQNGSSVRICEQIPEEAIADLITQKNIEEAARSSQHPTPNLQAIKRVTVIGETTGGGAHPTKFQAVDAHFSVAVPFARAINLTMKTNWEGTGVTPDVRVKSAEALQAAQRLAVNKIRAENTSK